MARPCGDEGAARVEAPAGVIGRAERGARARLLPGSLDAGRAQEPGADGGGNGAGAGPPPHGRLRPRHPRAGRFLSAERDLSRHTGRAPHAIPRHGA